MLLSQQCAISYKAVKDDFFLFTLEIYFMIIECGIPNISVMNSSLSGLFHEEIKINNVNEDSGRFCRFQLPLSMPKKALNKKSDNFVWDIT